jgi:hypothetical protein
MRDDHHGVEKSLCAFLSSLRRLPAEGPRSEVIMELLMEETSALIVEGRPVLTSHDSGDEHSLDHWLRVYWMVEEENPLAGEILIPELF